MLKTVAPEANYEQISGQILQDHDFLVGGKSVSKSCYGILGSLERVWEVSGGSLEVSCRSLGGL